MHVCVLIMMNSVLCVCAMYVLLQVYSVYAQITNQIYTISSLLKDAIPLKRASFCMHFCICVFMYVQTLQITYIQSCISDQNVIFLYVFDTCVWFRDKT